MSGQIFLLHSSFLKVILLVLLIKIYKQGFFILDTHLKKELKMRRLLFPLLVSIIFSTSAFSSNKDLGWACNLDFNANVQGTQVIFGQFSINGMGDFTCISDEGNVEKIPVKISMKSVAGPFGLSLGRYSLNGKALDVAVAGVPSDIFGEYTVVYGGAAGGLGLGSFTAVNVDNDSISLNVALSLTEGLGLSLGFGSMKIEMI